MSLFAWADPVIDADRRRVRVRSATQVRDALGDGVFTDFVVDGVIAGVGAVLVFLPQILLLFLFLGLLEDCGYLARVAYLMDRIMRTMNLHGRAFVPMLSGFACAVPAILATRTMERRRDRLLTMMVVPLMTCSARLPVYTLIIAALFPPASAAATQGLLMVGMYLFSVVDRARRRVGAVADGQAAQGEAAAVPDRAAAVPLAALARRAAHDVEQVVDVPARGRHRDPRVLDRAVGAALLPARAARRLAGLRRADRAAPTDEAQQRSTPSRRAQLANSYGGRLGHAIEPAIAPLGFDWKIGVGIVGAFAAREVFVSTLGVVYGVGGDADERLRAAARRAARREAAPTARRAYTPLVGLSLMVFFALACQCMSTLAVVRRETGELALAGVPVRAT